jgi:hypothetical protein
MNTKSPFAEARHKASAHARELLFQQACNKNERTQANRGRMSNSPVATSEQQRVFNRCGQYPLTPLLYKSTSSKTPQMARIRKKAGRSENPATTQYRAKQIFNTDFLS